MINRFAVPLAVTFAQLLAALVALGRPDAGPALAFLGGGSPTAGETLAALELLVWAIVILTLGWRLAELARQAAASRRVRQGSVLATGLLILVAGAAHHAGYQVGMSGGSVQEARSAIGR